MVMTYKSPGLALCQLELRNSELLFLCLPMEENMKHKKIHGELFEEKDSSSCSESLSHWLPEAGKDNEPVITTCLPCSLFLPVDWHVVGIGEAKPSVQNQLIVVCLA